MAYPNENTTTTIDAVSAVRQTAKGETTDYVASQKDQQIPYKNREADSTSDFANAQPKTGKPKLELKKRKTVHFEDASSDELASASVSPKKRKLVEKYEVALSGDRADPSVSSKKGSAQPKDDASENETDSRGSEPNQKPPKTRKISAKGACKNTTTKGTTSKIQRVLKKEPVTKKRAIMKKPTTPMNESIPNKKYTRKHRPPSAASPPLAPALPSPKILYKLHNIHRFLAHNPSTLLRSPHPIRNLISVPERTLLGALMRVRIDYCIGQPHQARLNDVGDIIVDRFVDKVEQFEGAEWVTIDCEKKGTFEARVWENVGLWGLERVNLLEVELELMAREQEKVDMEMVSGEREFMEDFGKRWAKVVARERCKADTGVTAVDEGPILELGKEIGTVGVCPAPVKMD